MKTAIPQAIKLAKEYGFELAEEDLVMDQASAEGVMDDDALDSVAGGEGGIHYPDIVGDTSIPWWFSPEYEKQETRKQESQSSDVVDVSGW